jgi:3-oxoacyl-[acyl-carrier-protein] synthase-1
MASMAMAEAFADIPGAERSDIPVLLCVAERERPGRLPGLDDRLLGDIGQETDMRLAPASAVIARGRVGVGVALLQARKLIHEHGHARVMIAATDGLLSWPTLRAYERRDRLLTARNSNGFMPGEAAGALLVGRPSGKPELVCVGIGFGMEPAPIDSEKPLRADGLTQAIRSALADAGCEMHHVDFRITDISGEQYYFKEASLALSRTLRARKPEFDLWHPAECIGESGAAAGAAILAVASAAYRKSYARGSCVLVHMANDAGERAAGVLHGGGA